MKTEDLKIAVYDIEVFKAMFLYCAYIPHLDKNSHLITGGSKFSFEISDRKNELDALIKHLLEADYQYAVGYNNIRYDSQVIQYIIEEHCNWYDKTTRQILQLIYECSQEAIERGNYELKPLYKKHYLDIKQIDLFKIHHYDNKNRRVGLKTLEFAMNLENIEEMPVDWRKEQLSEEEMDMTVKYCWNDVEATYKFWQITTGNTDNELYRGKDAIQARLDIIEELKFTDTTLNWSDVKIGDEINKKGYMKESGCTMNDIYDKKKKRGKTPPFTYDECIPKYVKFKSETMNELVNRVTGVKVSR